MSYGYAPQIPALRRHRAMLLVSALLMGTASPLFAETLRDSLNAAYQTNPTLAAARAGQRANDENEPIARSRGLPDVDLNAGFTENVKSASNSFTAPARLVTGQLSVGVPVYTGGAVKNAVRAARSRIEAGQSNLRGVESDLFVAVVGAYSDVIRDEAIVGLNRNQVKVLGTNLEATRDRFEVGDLTRTDVAQSEARLSTARSQLESVEAQLISSRERYVQLVGKEPEALVSPPELPNLPASVDAAMATALDHNPDLAAAKKAEEAARFDVASAKASRSPRLQAVANSSYTNFLNSLGSGIQGLSFSQTQTAVTAGLQATIPLFQGGGAAAQIRQSQARSGQAMEQLIELERGIVFQIRASYASWRAANAVIVSSEKAVSANTLSLEGVRAENSVGTRSILDILNAEQELLNSQVQLAAAKRNAYVAGFALLAAMGQAEARDLGLDGGALYDPTSNYNRVRGKIWDWSNDPAPSAVSTRTVDTKAQTPAIMVNQGRQDK
jgi:outer membrane protein